MANSYTWTVNSMDTYPEKDGYQNVVKTVYWTVTAADGENVTSLSLITELEFDPAHTFIPYGNLTQDDVIGWVKEKMTVEGEAQALKTLDAHLKTLATPPVGGMQLPWGA